MTISVEYDKKRDRVIIETDENDGYIDQRRILRDGQVMAAIKYYTDGKVTASDSFNLYRKLNEIHREKTGSHSDKITM